MRVLIINTSEKTGGAAIAATRLKEALIANGVKAKMLVCNKETDSLSVMPITPRWKTRWNFLLERFHIWATNGFSRKHLFEVDFATAGTDITRLPEFAEADIIHLHWINQGMLSLRSIRRILESGKPVVWTMHDMWPFTGVCHYAHSCTSFVNGCDNCRLLRFPGRFDASHRVWKRKEKVYKHGRIAFVACSRWLADLATQSKLLRGAWITDIPNAINTQRFKLRDQEKAREACRLPNDKRLILFSAYRTTMPIKGLDYFVEAVKKFVTKNPEMTSQIAIVAVGRDAELIANRFPCSVYAKGYINNEETMANIYSACDAFVIPSLQDNLPNTIVEAMACGTPCIATAVGGIPQMVHHLENGYLAEPRSADDIARGLEWLLMRSNRSAVSAAARTYAAAQYSQQHVAMRYLDVYRTLMHKTT